MLARPLIAAVILLACIGHATAAPLTNVTFVAFDIETTGFSARTDRIIEIGAVKFRGRLVIATFSTLVAPGIPIPRASRKVHGITDNMVTNAPKARRALRQFLEFAGDAVLLAHNAAFDLRFMAAETERNGIRFSGRSTIDTLPLARKWFPESRTHSLAALSKYLALPASESHRALADARRVRLVFLAGLAKEAPDATLAALTGSPPQEAESDQ